MRCARTTDLVVAGAGMSAGPVLDVILRGFPGRVEVIDRGDLTGGWQANPFYGTARSAPLDLTVPLKDDWVEFHDGSRAVSRIQKWWSARLTGGGAWLWYGQMSRFQPSDLDMPGLLSDIEDHSATKWPLSFDELAHYYAQVELALQPYGCSYGMDRAAYQGIECLSHIERPDASYFERSLINRLVFAGYRPYIGQTALGGRAWDRRPVPPLDLMGTVPDHPMHLRKTWIGLIRDRLITSGNVRVTANTAVARILFHGGAVTGVEIVERRPDGSTSVSRVRATLVVLACGAVETVRILLNSSLPDRNRMVGKSFTLTQERVAYLMTDIKRSHDPLDEAAATFANVVVKDFYQPTDPDSPVKCGKFALYDGYRAELPDRHAHNLRLRGSDLTAFIAEERSRYAVKVSFKGESLPWDGKRVELGNSKNGFGLPVARIRYRPHPYDRVIAEYAGKVIRDFAQALRATKTIIHPIPSGAGLISAHHHGGAIFGEDASKAVLDPYGECYEARGLFVADSAVMPTSGATNSTLTAMALAHRLAEHLLQRLGSESIRYAAQVEKSSRPRCTLRTNRTEYHDRPVPSG